MVQVPRRANACQPGALDSNWTLGSIVGLPLRAREAHYAEGSRCRLEHSRQSERLNRPSSAPALRSQDRARDSASGALHARKGKAATYNGGLRIVSNSAAHNQFSMAVKRPSSASRSACIGACVLPQKQTRHPHRSTTYDLRVRPAGSWSVVEKANAMRDSIEAELSIRRNATRLEEIKAEASDLLAKVDGSNTPDVIEEFSTLGNYALEQLMAVLEQVFIAASAKPNYTAAWVEIICALQQRYPEFPPGTSTEEVVTFASLVLRVSGTELRRVLSSLAATAGTVHHTRKAGALPFFRLLGKLFLKEFITLRFLREVIHALLCECGRDFDCLGFELVCELLMIVGPALDLTPSGKVLMARFLSRLAELVEKGCHDAQQSSAPTTPYSLVQTLTELRNAGWIWTFQMVVQLEATHDAACRPCVRVRSLSGEERALFYGSLLSTPPAALRSQISEHINVHESQIKMILPCGEVFE